MAAVALAACGSDSPVTPNPDAPAATPDASPGTGPNVDLTGTWISHVTTSGTITVPLLQPNRPATIDIVLRINVTRAAPNLNLKLEFCRVSTHTTDDSLIVDFSPTVLALLVDNKSEAEPSVGVGGNLPLPDFAVTIGQDTAGNSVDTDADGHPGVSIPSMLAGTPIVAYSSLVITLKFPQATLSAADMQTGTSTFTTNGKVFDATPLSLMGPITVTPPAGTPFTAKKLAGDVPCSTVLTMF